MSLGGTQCQSMALTHSLTHSILINLFIKQFSPTSLAKYCFVQECSVVFRQGGSRKAYIFARQLASLGTSLSNTLIEVGHFSFMWFCFVNMLFFTYRLLVTHRWKLWRYLWLWSCIVYNNTVGKVKELIQDIRPGGQSQKVRSWLA